MKVPIGGPVVFRLERNRAMTAGLIVFAVGSAGYGTTQFDLLPDDGVLPAVFFGVAIAGIALYFVGRLVQILGSLRKR